MGKPTKLYEVEDVFQAIGLPTLLENRKLNVLDTYYHTVDFRSLRDYFTAYDDYLRIKDRKQKHLQEEVDAMSKQPQRYILMHTEEGICGEYDYPPVLHGTLKKRTSSGRTKDLIAVKLNLVTHTVEIDNWLVKEVTFTSISHIVEFINSQWGSHFTVDQFVSFFTPNNKAKTMLNSIDDWRLMNEYDLYCPSLAEATFDILLDQLHAT